MSILELSYLSADAISTSSADEQLQPVQQFRLLTEHDFLGRPDALDYYWGLPKGTMNLFSELNLVSVRADIAQLLWAKRLALVPSLDLIPPMLQLLGDNLFCDTDSRRLCFEVRALPFDFTKISYFEAGVSRERVRLQIISFE
ncbi:hypothetical protein D9757_009500 [Collybiopsis confluens]|uniref:Uncharacterized protein n=1 Tax=Collybiopsis confluens TaxID=2823264 RepID=A0A8H5H501_9AGAR|nr:hypothetical protein D9757_009500 [Collybiopsis confluens]